MDGFAAETENWISYLEVLVFWWMDVHIKAFKRVGGGGRRLLRGRVSPSLLGGRR